MPRFLAALEDGGAVATRADAYVTRPGVSAEEIAPEAALMSGGCVDAIVFTSTAEAQGLLAALGGAEDLQALVLDQGAPPACPLCVRMHADMPRLARRRAWPAAPGRVGYRGLPVGDMGAMLLGY